MIHACGILHVLPHILGDEERITVRPSLRAGNDPSRPYNLETDQRIAEFKLARWRGPDAMRKRQTFKDLVMLGADTSGRRAELFVIDPEPRRFLATSTSTAAWALDRSPGALRTFTTVFGTPNMSVAQFTATHAAHVQITDLSAGRASGGPPRSAQRGPCCIQERRHRPLVLVPEGSRPLEIRNPEQRKDEIRQADAGEQRPVLVQRICHLLRDFAGGAPDESSGKTVSYVAGPRRLPGSSGLIM
ncbi:hypothetical protein PV413_22405 [Streptomyces scabiei]|uniref:hypothetical protein n=1 Tax=Streptomyces TaxID=1883 RepID=UPI000AE412F9|nr:MULTISPECIES: hypothetical protein [Streptomyces]MDW8471490.1 hypothetical protein [Streptomyces scabiei]MDX2569996.1 hypothetical protein [Streptomyces scabiei]MDX3150178.1 hypothetical protein [Streptomyces scabiei]MDX3157981.1 hypothetical protein [Streptomyces scabiei]MDX3257479.1 hypothetical protein [Streptomyces scabiei]